MNYIVIAIILLILSLAIIYIVKAKKNGARCIGCVHSKTCSGHCHEQPKPANLKTTELKQTGKMTCNHNCSNCSNCHE